MKSSKPSQVKIPAAFNDHKRKDVIRKVWCKPQLKALNQVLSHKLIYLGLPDIEAKDVLEWIEYIDKVIAFQCSEYKNRAIDVKKLDSLLDTLEREGKIKSGVVYQGWMEDIVMGGISERGQTFRQTDYLRIYNLDFCDNLKTPRQVRDAKGNVIDIIYKTQVIEKLLMHQSKVTAPAKSSFIMYLTVNSQSFQDDGTTIKDPAIKAYLKKVKGIKKTEVKAAREMKAYCYSTLRSIFHDAGYHVEFLPTVYYLGSGYPNRTTGGQDNHRMMTFTVLGTQRQGKEPIHQQDAKTFLEQKFVWATDKAISAYQDTHITEMDFECDSMKLIKNSPICQKYWIG
jgi:hypothetical protein